MLDIICGKFFICHAPYEAERFQSLPPDLAEKYREKFQYPERFARINDKIVAVPFKPQSGQRTVTLGRTGFPKRPHYLNEQCLFTPFFQNACKSPR